MPRSSAAVSMAILGSATALWLHQLEQRNQDWSDNGYPTTQSSSGGSYYYHSSHGGGYWGGSGDEGNGISRGGFGETGRGMGSHGFGAHS